jgi:holo-ACP synthase/triphosphoribosyl-dephospho-CoA synthase
MAAEEPGDEGFFKCLLAISSNNNDTNILYRGGPEILIAFQGLCLEALENFNTANLSAVAGFCENENISPGGSADLLAVTLFIDSVMHADQRKEFTPLSEINDF